MVIEKEHDYILFETMGHVNTNIFRNSAEQKGNLPELKSVDLRNL